MNIRLLLSIAATLLLCFVVTGCADEETGGAEATADSTATGPPRLEMSDPSNAFAEDIPEDAAALEEAIALQHTYLMGQVSKKAVDSLMRANIMGADDPRQGRRAAEKELLKLMRRQDTLARRTLVNEFGRDAEEIDAILKREGIERP